MEWQRSFAVVLADLYLRSGPGRLAMISVCRFSYEFSHWHTFAVSVLTTSKENCHSMPERRNKCRRLRREGARKVNSVNFRKMSRNSTKKYV